MSSPGTHATWLRTLAQAAAAATRQYAARDSGDARLLARDLGDLTARLEQDAADAEREEAILRPVDPRVERIGRNEVLFREVNERLKEIGTDFSFVTEAAEFVCECGDVSCAAPIRMTLAEYEQIRSDAALFALVSGHEEPDVESVVEEHDGWSVVRKHPGEPEAIAEAGDPRS